MTARELPTASEPNATTTSASAKIEPPPTPSEVAAKNGNAFASAIVCKTNTTGFDRVTGQRCGAVISASTAITAPITVVAAHNAAHPQLLRVNASPTSAPPQSPRHTSGPRQPSPSAVPPESKGRITPFLEIAAQVSVRLEETPPAAALSR